jgi:PPM family protein phosphatase
MTGLRVVEVAHASDTGRVRSHNEDRSLAEPPLLAVADGMGGAAAGEVAAQLAVEALSGLGGSPGREELRERIRDANRSIWSMADADPDRAGMGTTLTAALLDEGGATLMHVGDSRAYLLRAGELRQLTDDHSVVAELVRQGALAPEDAERHPNRNIITRALGTDSEIQIDETDLDLRPGDVVLLCTDGLSAMIRDEDIERLLREAPSLQDGATGLVDAAISAGGLDNVTVVLARIGTVDGAAAEPAPPPAADASQAEGATGEMPVVRPASAPMPRAGDMRRIPSSTQGGQKSSRPARVLEGTTRQRRGRGRRAALVVLAVLLLAGAALAWVASRTYWVDASSSGDVRVYHGLPISVGGLHPFVTAGETGLQASTVRAVDPAALGRAWLGQGDAVERAGALVWRVGLPAIVAIPPPARPRSPRGAA